MSITSYPTLITTVSSDIDKVGGKNSTIGQIREDKDGRKFILMPAGGTIPAGVAVYLTSSTLIKAPDEDVPIFGVNTTGGALADGEYFWCQVYGQATVLTDGSSTILEQQIVGTSDGALTDATADGLGQYCVGFALATDASTVGNVFINPVSATDTDT